MAQEALWQGSASSPTGNDVQREPVACGGVAVRAPNGVHGGESDVEGDLGGAVCGEAKDFALTTSQMVLGWWWHVGGGIG